MSTKMIKFFNNSNNKSMKTEDAKRFLIHLICIGILFINAGILLAQNTQTTENKADSNLKSAARVNPSTLAMEFSLPLGGYPGRGGNSKPVILNYSSKVWTAKKVNYRYESNEAVNQYYDFLVYQSTDVGAEFAEKSIAGWTSSLQPLTIINEPGLYNQFGEMMDLLTPNFSNPNINEDCTEDTFIDFRASCGGWAWVTVTQCCPSDGYCSMEVSFECIFPSGGGGPTGGGGPYPTPTPPPPPPGPIPPSPTPQIPHIVKRINVQMPNGSSVEFRKDDKVYNCAETPEECNTNATGTYLSVDGSGMRLEKDGITVNNELRDVLYLSNGGKYIFTALNSHPGIYYPVVEKYIDPNGNVSTYNAGNRTWTDTLGREIKDPLNNPFSFHRGNAEIQTYNVKGINNENLTYSLKWSIMSDVFEDPENTETKILGADTCNSVLANPVNGETLFKNPPVDTLDDQIENRTRYIRKQRMCASPSGWGQVITFNPVVLSEITQPNGQKYQFKYNEYGEITKIIYPTGGYERFEYSEVPMIGATTLGIYSQTNRGVRKRFVSVDGVNETQEWTYGWTYEDPNGFAMVTTAPDGTKSERFIHQSEQSAWGFEDPRNGMVKEERVRDANGSLRSRTLTDWIVTPAQGTGAFGHARRDTRPGRTISIIIENDQALATMSETEYENPDEQGSTVPTDLSYFARLNAKRVKTYH